MCNSSSEVPSEIKTRWSRCYLLIWIGDKGRDVHNTWILTYEEIKKLDMYYNGFKAYVQPTLTPVFNNEVQGQQVSNQFSSFLPDYVF